jgi:hypothetical protein
MKHIKKSQVTIFIIIGIFILFFFSLSIFIYQNQFNKVPIASKSSVTFDSFVNNCFENSVGEAIFYIGNRGGFNYTPQDSIFFIDRNFSNLYHFYKNQNDISFLPSFFKMKDNLESKILNNLLLCFNNFEDYKIQGYNIEIVKLNIDAVIETEYLIVVPDIIINYQRNNEFNSVRNIPNINVPLKLGKMHEVAEHIINYYHNQKSIPIYSNYMESLVDSHIFWNYYIDSSNKIHYYILKQENKGLYEQVHNYDEHFKFLFAIEFKD